MPNKHIRFDCYLGGITEQPKFKADYEAIASAARAGIRQIFNATGTWPVKGDTISVDFEAGIWLVFEVTERNFSPATGLNKQRAALLIFFNLLFIKEE